MMRVVEKDDAFLKRAARLRCGMRRVVEKDDAFIKRAACCVLRHEAGCGKGYSL